MEEVQYTVSKLWENEHIRYMLSNWTSTSSLNWKKTLWLANITPIISNYNSSSYYYKTIGLEVFNDVIITFSIQTLYWGKIFQPCTVLLRMIRWKKPVFNTALYDKYSWNMIYGTGKNAPHLWHIYWKLLCRESKEGGGQTRRKKIGPRTHLQWP